MNKYQVMHSHIHNAVKKLFKNALTVFKEVAYSKMVERVPILQIHLDAHLREDVSAKEEHKR